MNQFDQYSSKTTVVDLGSGLEAYMFGVCCRICAFPSRLC